MLLQHTAGLDHLPFEEVACIVSIFKNQTSSAALRSIASKLRCRVFHTDHKVHEGEDPRLAVARQAIGEASQPVLQKSPDTPLSTQLLLHDGIAHAISASSKAVIKEMMLDQSASGSKVS